MMVNIETRTIESPLAVEIYISATPAQNAPPSELARQIFSAVADVICSGNFRILQERIFAVERVMGIISQARQDVYRKFDIDDGVAPTYLVSGKGTLGAIDGVQVHAVSGDIKIEPINVGKYSCGRILRAPGYTIITLSSISATKVNGQMKQARACFEKAESILRNFGADFSSVSRTWIWLRDIISWYGDFNHVRSTFLTEQGLLGQASQLLPASTGIGLHIAPDMTGNPVGGQSSCAMDLFAVLEPPNSTQYLRAVGRQQCALEYGSAFSRASRAITPAGQTLFVSGTASIDSAGATTNVNNAEAQISATIENVRAVLADMGATDKDVATAVAYCKTTQVEKEFDRVRQKLRWPLVVVICDICRADLLFEMEATAVVK